jgi:hypothetical protein
MPHLAASQPVRTARLVLAGLLPVVLPALCRTPPARCLPCWLWHSEVVEELLWLRSAWRAAYADPARRSLAGGGLARPAVHRGGAESWVLKGAGALIAQLDVARHSKDIDLHWLQQAEHLRDAEIALRRAAARDLDDHFTFTLGRPPR